MDQKQEEKLSVATSSSSAEEEEEEEEESYLEDEGNTVASRKSTFTPHDQTPCGLNRFVHLAFCLIFVFYCGATISNWPPLRQMLARAGAYFWLCNEGDELDSDLTCEAQRVQLTQLGNVAQTMSVIGSVIGGFMFDWLGPRICGVVGVCGFVISFFLLAFATESQQTYWGWIVFQGVSIELAYFGVMSSANLFPAKRKSVFALLGGMRSLGTLIAYVQLKGVEAAGGSLKGTGLGLAFAGVALTPIAWFLLPGRPFEMIYVDAGDKEILEAELTAASIEIRSMAGSMKSGAGGPATSTTFGTNTIYDEPEGWRLLLKRILDPFYLVWTVGYIIIYAATIFYTLSVSEQSPRVKNVYGFILPFSVIPSYCLGLLMDMIGSLEVIMIQNVFRVLMFGLLMVENPNLTLQVIPLICFLIQMGLLVSANYALIQDYYDLEVQGRLSGILNAIGGLVSLANTPLYSWASGENKFRVADTIYLILSLAAMALMSFMLFIGSAVFRRRTLRRCQKTRRATSIIGGGAQIRRNNSSVTSFTYAAGI